MGDSCKDSRYFERRGRRSLTLPANAAKNKPSATANAICPKAGASAAIAAAHATIPSRRTNEKVKM